MVGQAVPLAIRPLFRLSMNGDIRAGCEFVDSGFDFVRDRVGLGKRLGAIDQDVQVHKKHRAGVADAYLVAIAHSGDRYNCGGNTRLHSFGGAIQQRINGAAAEP